MRRIGFMALGVSLAGFGFLVSTVDAQVPATNKAVLGTWGVDLVGMDKSVKPGDDFFRYVSGAWFATAEIPPDRTTTGSFVQLDIQSETRVRGIMTELEGFTAAEVGESLGLPINTVYSRLRLARRDFAKIVRSLHARAEWKQT